MRFWNFAVNAATDTEPESVELHIDGEIVDEYDAWLYEWMGVEHTSRNEFRDEIARYAGHDITVWINSPGGDLLAAAGIYNALQEHRGRVTVKIDGEACSAASVIAMAGDEVLMSPVALMMIHNPLAGVIGEARQLRHVADVLDEAKETLINAYVLKTGRSRRRISEMMDAETYMSARTAMREGFADGMLYTDAQSIDGMRNFAFGRATILNSANRTIERMLAITPAAEPQEQQKQTGENPDDIDSRRGKELLLMLDLI